MFFVKIKKITVSHWKKKRLKEMNKILKHLGHRQHKTYIFMNTQVNSNYNQNKYKYKALIKDTNKNCIIKTKKCLSAKYNK